MTTSRKKGGWTGRACDKPKEECVRRSFNKAIEP
jgi:hypothetical protein